MQNFFVLSCEHFLIGSAKETIEKASLRDYFRTAMTSRGPQTRQKARATSIPRFHVMNGNFSQLIKLENSDISNYSNLNSQPNHVRWEMNLLWIYK